MENNIEKEIVSEVAPAKTEESPSEGIEKAIKALDQAIEDAKYIVINPPPKPKIAMSQILTRRLNRALELARKNEVAFRKRRIRNRMARESRRINREHVK
jgi:hypothetical protein